MSQVSSQELSLLRSRPQRTKLSLSIFQPTTIFQARVNDASIARNEYQITYDSVTFGDYTAVEAGMTLLIGSTSGARDLGKVRVRSITSSVITVAENSDIQWANNAYLTIQRYWELWPVYPRIISDPADPEDTIWYKDFDILYTNQNRYLGAFPCAGPHRAAYLDGGSATIYYTATGTHNVLDDSVSYHWFFEGATVTGSSALTPGNRSYDTAGHYVTRLTTSGSNYVDTTYRYVSIYDKPGEGTNVPPLHWEITSIEGNRSGGGYTMDVRIWETIDLHEGDVVVLFGESWFGSSKQTIGGNATGNSDIFFVGHILKDTIKYDYKVGEVTFTVGSVTEFAKDMEGFSVSIESVINPKDWYQLYDMNIERAIYHYVKWHTTLMSIADIQVPIADRPVQYFDSDRESIYDAMNSWVQGTLLGRTVTDMQGKVWPEMGAQAFPRRSGLPYRTPAMTIQKGDWIGTPRIEELPVNQMSFFEAGGIQFNGVATGTFKPLMSQAPGDAPGYRGSMERIQGLALAGQVELNHLTGNYRANLNHPYQRIDYDMVQSMRNLDIAPQTTVGVIINAEDTPRNVYISGSYLIDNLTWKYDSKKQLFYPSNVSVIPFVTGTGGQTLPIPELPPSSNEPRNVPKPSVPQYYPSTFKVGDYIQLYVSTYTFGTATNITWTEQREKVGSALSWDGGQKLIFEYTGWYAVSLNMRVSISEPREDLVGFQVNAYNSSGGTKTDWDGHTTLVLVTKTTSAATTHSGLGHNIAFHHYFDAGDYIRIGANLVFFMTLDTYYGTISATKLS